MFQSQPFAGNAIVTPAPPIPTGKGKGAEEQLLGPTAYHSFYFS